MSPSLRRIALSALALCVAATAAAAPPVAAPAAVDPGLRLDGPLPAVTKDRRTLEMSLGEWMQALAVPGVAIAVIDDYRIVATQGFGVATAGGETAVTPGTLFQAASIAKPVTALAVLRQVERGTFALDYDINDVLRTWTLPASDTQHGKPVTIRRLLAHTGGITPGGFAGYRRGAPRPTIAQVLAGAAPASNSPARVETTPGTEVAYSGLGYSLLQLALEDSTREPFAALMHDEVLAPLGMASSTFAIDLPNPLAARAASGHIGFGVALEGGWLVNPESAAAGLWSTPADLARLLIDVARAKRGDADSLISPATARAMLTPQLDDMGLGFIVRGDDPNGLFAHSGGGAGWFAHVEMLAGTGQGIVVMTNADAGQALAPLLITQVATAHDWPLPDRRKLSPARIDRLFARVDAVADRPVRMDVPDTVLARYPGRYELAPGMVFDITLVDGQLQLQLADQPRFPLFAQSATTFFLEAVDAKVSFVVDAAGTPTALVLHQGGRDQTAPRLD